jgi:hypothetical protein
MFRTFLAHPQDFLHCMVSRSLWQTYGCMIVWFGIRWLVWCGPSSHNTVCVDMDIWGSGQGHQVGYLWTLCAWNHQLKTLNPKLNSDQINEKAVTLY